MRREKDFLFTTTVNDLPVLRKGKGCRFVDLEGKEYIDGCSQISLLNTGYSPIEVVSYIIKQLDSGIHTCISADWAFVNETSDGVEISRAALAEKLIKLTDRIMPRPKRVIFEVSGATAINAAARIAAITYLRNQGKWNTQKFEELFLHQDLFIPSHHDPFCISFLAFKNAFHGRHGVAKLLTDSKAVQYWGPSSSAGVGRLDLPRRDTNIGIYLRNVDDLIRRLENYAPVIAFFFEPIQGEGGINVPDTNGLRRLVDYLRKRGIYIIADEIQTGFLRTGKMFGCEHYSIHPDMITFSKSLAAGLPLGAVVANADLFPDLEPGMHSGSMHCSPLCCAAAMANLSLIEKCSAFKVTSLGNEALFILKIYQHTFPDIIQDVRGKGLFIGIELRTIKQRRKLLFLARIVNRKLGLLLAPCGEKTIRFCPPVTIDENELFRALVIFCDALKRLEESEK